MSIQESAKKTSRLLLPVMLLGAVLMILAMLRLGVWQLDRAQQKTEILNQVQTRAQQPAVSLSSLARSATDESWRSELRFRQVSATGRYLADKSVLIENQVLNKQGGYLLITPLALTGSDYLVMVARAWLPAGATRQDLPSFDTPTGQVSVYGRLNKPPAQPPLWREGYPINEGPVWQYLPIQQYASQIEAKALPLMVELAPENDGNKGLTVQWHTINDEWVAKHKGYAFQWFSMAAAFFIACLILLTRKLSRKPKTDL